MSKQNQSNIPSHHKTNNKTTITKHKKQSKTNKKHSPIHTQPPTHPFDPPPPPHTHTQRDTSQKHVNGKNSKDAHTHTHTHTHATQGEIKQWHGDRQREGGGGQIQYSKFSANRQNNQYKETRYLILHTLLWDSCLWCSSRCILNAKSNMWRLLRGFRFEALAESYTYFTFTFFFCLYR